DHSLRPGEGEQTELVAPPVPYFTNAPCKIFLAGSEPSSWRNMRCLNFQPCAVRTSSQRFAVMRCTRKPLLLPWLGTSTGSPCVCGTRICRYDVTTAVSPSIATCGSPVKCASPPAIAAWCSALCTCLARVSRPRGLESVSPRSNTPSSTQQAAMCSLPPVSALGGWLAIRL